MFGFYIRLLVLSTFLLAQPALAGLPPTRSGGQSGTLSTTFDFKAPYSQVTKYSGTGGLIETGNYNIAKNPGFEAATYSTSWAVTGGTLAAATTTNIFFGKGATWDSSAASQEFSSDLVAVPEGFKANNCEGSIYIKVPSGTATHTLRVVDGSLNVLASATVVNSTYFTKNTLTFPCPTSGSIALQIISVASDEPLIALDEAYLGLARNVGVADFIGERIAYSPTFNSTTGHSASNGWYYRLGSYAVVGGAILFNGTGAASTFTFSMPPGLVIDTSRLNNSTVADLRNRVGSWSWYDDSGGLSINPQWVKPNTDTTLLFVDGSNTVISNSFANNDRVSWEVVVPIVGWAASQVVMPDAQGWWAGATLWAVTPVNLGTTSVGKNEVDQNDITLAAMTGSAPVGVVCASGNPSPVGGTTCSAGNEVIGVTTNVPRSGSYEVCVAGQNLIQDGSSTTNMSLFNRFIIDYTSSSSSTAIQTGVAQGTSGMQTNSGTGIETIYNIFPFRVCDVFQVSAGQATFRLTVAVTASGTVGANNLQPNTGQTYVTVRPVNSQQQAMLANSVSTPNTNGAIMFGAGVNAADCTSTPCTLYDGSTPGVTITRASTGVYSLNYAGLGITKTPTCAISHNRGSGDYKCDGGSATTTSQTIFCYQNTTGSTWVAVDSRPSAVCQVNR